MDTTQEGEAVDKTHKTSTQASEDSAPERTPVCGVIPVVVLCGWLKCVVQCSIVGGRGGGSVWVQSSLMPFVDLLESPQYIAGSRLLRSVAGLLVCGLRGHSTSNPSRLPRAIINRVTVNQSNTSSVGPDQSNPSPAGPDQSNSSPVKPATDQGPARSDPPPPTDNTDDLAQMHTHANPHTNTYFNTHTHAQTPKTADGVGTDKDPMSIDPPRTTSGSACGGWDVYLLAVEAAQEGQFSLARELFRGLCSKVCEK
ncbi:hypothetical protein SARC_13851 [Sphaeroforma arctica JP610]|uniref:Uncharacterized protein n=1 Tax=Sphaeroforma arctica JP610 TaxID=667725 RepID=A0A0L0FA41_9EUKA|nr:hypothetical protein SARC_13851 [Sphaeroforma arctica JP610]KNC73590.1 hypothetical protein SARC_13851 [Sphaeroforma arctica JP610]|eukprot:XP_014147492.1 hypothetical protein SARC_13851 [Sphaeroforma arctica JP610]